jgi:integrase
MAKITKRLVDSILRRPVSYRVWDSEMRGFAVRVQPSGLKSYFLKYRAASGRQRWQRLGRVSEITPEEARKIARGILNAVDKGEDPGAVRMTVRELAARFLAEHAEAKRKPLTASNYHLLVDVHVLPWLGDYKADRVTIVDVAELHRAIAKKRHNGKRVIGGQYQANRAIAVISSMYSFASRHHFVPRGFNPANGIEKYREQGRECFLDPAKLARLGDAIREAETIGIEYDVNETGPKAKHAARRGNRRVVISPFAAAALRLLVLTGARLREILRLRWGDVDLDRGLLRIADSKTGKKTIILNAPALAVLAGLPRAGDYVIAGNDPKKPRADLARPWELVTRRAELPDVRIHDLRHTHASFGVGAGLGLPIIGKLLGHTKAATTQRYAHLDNDPLRRASERIGGEIAAAMGEKAAPAGDVMSLTRR